MRLLVQLQGTLLIVLQFQRCIQSGNDWTTISECNVYTSVTVVVEQCAYTPRKG